MNSPKDSSCKLDVNQSTSLESFNKSTTASQMIVQIVTLNNQRKSLEEQLKFVEAGKITKQLEELEEIYKRQYIKEIEQKLSEQRQTLEIEYQQECQNFQRIWEEKIEQNEQEIKSIVDQIHQKQNQEKLNFEEELKKQVMTDKKSPEILNLDFKIQKLVKNLQYNEASVLTKQRDELIKRQKKIQEERFSKKLKNLKKSFKNNLQKELEAYEQKLRSERDNIFKMRNENFEQLEQKYKVIKDKTNSTLKQHLNKEKKKITTFKAINCFDVNQTLKSIQEFQLIFYKNEKCFYETCFDIFITQTSFQFRQGS